MNREFLSNGKNEGGQRIWVCHLRQFARPVSAFEAFAESPMAIDMDLIRNAARRNEYASYDLTLYAEYSDAEALR